MLHDSTWSNRVLSRVVFACSHQQCFGSAVANLPVFLPNPQDTFPSVYSNYNCGSEAHRWRERASVNTLVKADLIKFDLPLSSASSKFFPQLLQLLFMPDFKTALGGRLSESVHQIETTKSGRGRGIKAGKQMQSEGSFDSGSNL